MLQLGHFSFVRIALADKEEAEYDEANNEKRSNANSNSNDSS